MTDMKKSLEIGINVDKNSIKNFSNQVKQSVADMKKQATGPAGKANKQQQKDFANVNKQAKAYQDNVKKTNKELEKQLKLTQQISKESKQSAGVFGRVKTALAATQEKIATMFKRMRGRGGDGGDDRPPDRRGGGGGGFFSRVNQAGGNFAGRVVSGLMEGAVGILQRGYSEFNSYDMDRSRLAHMLRRGKRTPQDIEDQLRGGQRFGYSMRDSVGHMAALSRSTGGTNLLSLLQATSRGTGLGVEEMSGIAGTMTRAGSDMKSEKGRKTFARMLSDSVKSGLDDSRTGEHLEAVSSIVQATSATSAGEVNVKQISGMLANIGGKLGAGFQGERGAQFLGGFDRALKGGGGGDSQKAFMLQAMGFGTPGGGSSYYSAIKAMQQGIFGTGGADNFVKLLQHAEGMGGGGEETNYILSQISGATLEQIEKFRSVFQGEGIEGLKKAISSEVNPDATERDMMKDAMSSFLEGVKHESQLDNRMVEAGREIAHSVRALQNATNELFDKTMVGVLNDIFNALAHDVVPAIRDITAVLAPIFSEVRDFIRSLHDYFHSDESDSEEERQAAATRAEHDWDPIAGQIHQAAVAATALRDRVRSDPQHAVNQDLYNQYVTASQQLEEFRGTRVNGRSIIEGDRNYRNRERVQDEFLTLSNIVSMLRQDMNNWAREMADDNRNRRQAANPAVPGTEVAHRRPRQQGRSGT